jgi:vesicle transport protein SEC22
MLFYIEMSHISGELKDSAKMFKDKARHLNLQALYRKYGPPVVIALVIMGVMLLRYYYF